MEQPMIDPNNHEEQLYYPPPNYIIENVVPQEDNYFIDKTNSSSNETQNNQNRNGGFVSCLIKRIITRTDVSSFTLLNAPVIYIAIILVIVCGVFVSVQYFFFFERDIKSIIICSVSLLVSIIVALLLSCKVYSKKILTLEYNSIVLTEKALLSTKNIVYHYGELERAELCYTNAPSQEGFRHTFFCYFVKKTGEREAFHAILTPKVDVDLKGVKYFIDLINQHIQKYMG